MKNPSALSYRIAGVLINQPLPKESGIYTIEDTHEKIAQLIDKELGDMDAMDREQSRIAIAQQKKLVNYRKALSSLVDKYLHAEELKEFTSALEQARAFLADDTRDI